MNTGNSFEGEVMELLSQLKAKKDRVMQQYKSELDSIDQQIEAVSTTARLLRQSPKQNSPARNGSIIPDLHGMTIKQGCIEIAKRNDHIVRVSDARDALIAAGVMSEGKNSWGIVNTTLVRSKEFEKFPAERGAYRYTTESIQQQLSVA